MHKWRIKRVQVRLRRMLRGLSAGPSKLGMYDAPRGPALSRWLKRFARWALVAMGLFLILSLLSVIALRWIDPPTSAFMLRHWMAASWAGQEPAYPYHEWVDWDAIPGEVALAAIAAEDQRFPKHGGFDLEAIGKAWEANRQGKRLRGASSISQQTAKNLFLWPGRSYPRKALEAWFTVLIEIFWSKQRILEVYLNIAQFSPDTYGVGATAWRYFDRPVVALGRDQAARMAAVLPNPVIYRIDKPSARVLRKQAWIKKQMRQLGGVVYLERLQ